MILQEGIQVTGSSVRFIKSATNGARFIQVFDAEDAEVVRLCLNNDFEIDESLISVTKRGRPIQAQVTRMYTLDEQKNRLPVLSLRVPRNSAPFVVRTDGRPLARLTKETYERLATQRNFDMVNPSIDGAYPEWLAQHEHRIELEAPDSEQLVYHPLFSIIVPLFQTPIPFFHDMVSSVLSQTYSAWELILVNASPKNAELRSAIASYDDARLRVVTLEDNLGIAGNTNAGIRVARGDYICFFDHDDMLDPHILAYYAEAINNNRTIDLLYCDEDNFHSDLSDRYAPMLKPDFNLDLLYSHNYVVHMLTVSRTALEQIDLSPDSTSGAQDYDLTLKVSEIARSICHIPYVLYHWRAHAGSTNGGLMESKPYAIQASIEALSAHFERRSIAATVEPTDIACVFRERYGYQGVVDDTTRVDIDPSEHWGRAALAAARGASDHPLLICAPGLKLHNEAGIRELFGCLSRPEVGIVAPKVFYPDGLVQNCGLIIDDHRSWHLLNQNFSDHMGGGYHGLSECSCNYTAVGPVCMAVSAKDILRYETTIERLQSPLDFAIGLCALMSRDGKLCTVLPHIKAQCNAPVLWEQCDLAHAYGPMSSAVIDKEDEGRSEEHPSDLLANPNLTCESGYLQLQTGRDRAAAVQQVLSARQHGRIAQIAKKATRALLHR